VERNEKKTRGAVHLEFWGGNRWGVLYTQILGSHATRGEGGSELHGKRPGRIGCERLAVGYRGGTGNAKRGASQSKKRKEKREKLDSPIETRDLGSFMRKKRQWG